MERWSYCIYYHCSVNLLAVPSMDRWNYCIYPHCSVNSLYPPWRGEVVLSTTIDLWTHCTLNGEVKLLYLPPLICELTVPSMERWSYCIHHHCSVNLLCPPWRGEIIVSTTIDLWTLCTLHWEVMLLYLPPLFCELTVPSMERWSYCIFHHCSVNSLYPPWRGEVIVSTTIDLWTHCTLNGEVKLLYPPPLFCELAVPSMERWNYCIYHHWSVNSLYPPWRGDVIVSTTIVLWTHCTLHGEVKLLYFPPLFCELTVPSMERWSYCIYYHWSVNSMYPPWRDEIIVSTTIDLWTHCTLHRELKFLYLLPLIYELHVSLSDENTLYIPPLICELAVPFFKMRTYCIPHHWILNSLYSLTRWEYSVSTTTDL